MGLTVVMGLFVRRLMTGCKYKVVFVFDFEMGETCHETRSIRRLVGPYCCHGTCCKKSHDRMQIQRLTYHVFQIGILLYIVRRVTGLDSSYSDK